jgi:hypothetical protein
MKTMKVEGDDIVSESVTNAFVIKKAYLFGAVFITGLVFTGSILGTYFGTKSSNDRSIGPDDTTKTPPLTTTTAMPTTISTTISTTTTTPWTISPIPPLNEYRLPKELEPIHYDLMFDTFFESDTKPEDFNASLKLLFRCIRDTNKLVLNMKDLDLYNSTMKITSQTHASYNSPSGFGYNYNNQTQIFSATFVQQNQWFKAGNNYTFHVEFKGYLKDDDLGFYRTSYTDGEGIKR